MTSNQNQQGISIIELMAVICIMTVLMGFAYMGADLARDARLRGVTQELLSDLQLARAKAMSHDAAGYGIRFQSATSYVLFRFENCDNDNAYDDNTCAGSSREEASATIKNISPNVALKSQGPTDDFTDNILIFDQDGLSRSATGAFGNMTIVVRNAADELGMKCITVSATRVREGVWGWDRHKGANSCLESRWTEPESSGHDKPVWFWRVPVPNLAWPGKHREKDKPSFSAEWTCHKTTSGHSTENGLLQEERLDNGF